MYNINKLVELAEKRLRNVIIQTPLFHSNIFSEISHINVYLKAEHLQKTGSFKIRGAYNKIIQLSDTEKQKGVIASSAGNHAQGVALAATKSKINSVIVMPETAPLAKIEATKNYGANVILHGQNFDEAFSKAKEIQAETGATFIHAFDDLDVIAGQGTIGVELLKDMSNFDAVMVPIGGGGLIAGIGAVIKNYNPNIRVIGVESAGSASMYGSIKADEIVELDKVSNFADGIAVKKPGEITYQLCQKYVDDFIVVNDADIKNAMFILLERAKQMVEPSGATAVAALLSKNQQQLISELTGKNIAIILSGGNVDVDNIAKIISRGISGEKYIKSG